MVAVVLGWLAFSGREERRSDARQETDDGSAQPPVGALLAETVRRDLPQPLTVEPPVSPAPPAAAAAGTSQVVLHGFVLNEEHKGIAGALVLEAESAATATTDAGGSFTLDVRFDLKRPWLNVYAWAEGWSIGFQSVRLPDVPRLVLRPEAPLTVVVADRRTKLPVAGARARILVSREWRFEGEVYRARFADLPVPIALSNTLGELIVPGRGENCQLEVRADGYQPRAVSLGPRLKRVELTSEQSFLVRLVRADGTPLAGAVVAFPNSATAVTSDAGGWVQVPAETLGRIWALQVREGERAWLHLSEPNQVDAAAPPNIVVDHFPRLGRVLLPEATDGAAFEVATAAGRASGWSDGLIPDPAREPDALAWHTLQSDGSFALAGGWQSTTTSVVVRDRASGIVLARQRLEGNGPYEVPLRWRHPLRLTVLAHPPELLDGAQILLREGWTDKPSVPSSALAGGVAELEVAKGSYRVQLLPAGRPAPIALGELEMPEGPFEAVFDLGAVRTISGTVTAGGEPVFPSQLHFWAAAGWSADARADELGRWSIDWAPQSGVSFSLTPEDAWLGEPSNVRHEIPDQARAFDLDLAVATLELSLDPAWPVEAGRLSARREPLPEQGRTRFREGPRGAARLPALGQGVARLRATPCALEFSTSEPFTVLETRRVELRAGEVRHLQIRGATAGSLQVRCRGETGFYLARELRLEPVGAPAPGAGWSLDPTPDHARERRAPGSLRPGYFVLPGTWRVRIGAPIRWEHDGSRHLVDSGSWELTVPVERRRVTVVWLNKNDDGSYSVEHDLLD